MAWRLQATSHHLSHCWPQSMSSYGVLWPQRLNKLSAPDTNKVYISLGQAHVIRTVTLREMLIPIRATMECEYQYTHHGDIATSPWQL